MLDVQNHDGLLSFLFGMIILVFAGVGLTMLADGVTRSGNSRSEIQSVIEQQGKRISILQNTLNSKKSQVEASESNLALNAHKKRMLSLSYEAVVARHADLDRLRKRLKDSLAKTNESFDDFRIATKKRAWLQALGNSLGRLQTTEGRVFNEALLVDVNDEGISIRHTGGTATIPPDSLGKSYWNLFLWDDGGAQDPSRRSSLPEIVSQTANSAHDKRPKVNQAKLRLLRSDLLAAGEEIERFSAEIRGLSSSRSSSISLTAPGTLETWTERRARLFRRLGEAEVRFAAARAELMIHFPEDPLLRRWSIYGPRFGYH